MTAILESVAIGVPPTGATVALPPASVPGPTDLAEQAQPVRTAPTARTSEAGTAPAAPASRTSAAQPARTAPADLTEQVQPARTAPANRASVNNVRMAPPER
jgi:hypothetical protein